MDQLRRRPLVAVTTSLALAMLLVGNAGASNFGSNTASGGTPAHPCAW